MVSSYSSHVTLVYESKSTRRFTNRRALDCGGRFIARRSGLRGAARGLDPELALQHVDSGLKIRNLPCIRGFGELVGNPGSWFTDPVTYASSRNHLTHGVRFLAVSQSIDTDESNPTSRLLLHILASVAEFERELIRERVRAGIKSAKYRGKQVGRRRVVFDRSKTSAMHDAGATLRQIASALGVGKGTIQRFLAQNSTGITRFSWTTLSVCGTPRRIQF